MENNDEGPSVATLRFVFILIIVSGIFLIGSWIFNPNNGSTGTLPSNIYEYDGKYYSAPSGGTAGVGGVYYYENGQYYEYDSASGQKKATGWVPDNVRKMYENDFDG